MLDPRRFVRIRRSALLNVDRIQKISPIATDSPVATVPGGRVVRSAALIVASLANRDVNTTDELEIGPIELYGGPRTATDRLIRIIRRDTLNGFR